MHSLLVGIHDAAATLENNLAISYKVQHMLIIQPRNLAIYPRELKIYDFTKTYMSMLVAVYLLNTENKSPSSSKCISKFYYITVVEYSSPI